MYPSATGEKKQMLYQYYQELIKDRNAIIEALNEEQKEKVQENMGYDPEEAKRKEEEERKRLKEEEDRLIEQKRREEEEKMKQKTLIESINNSQIPKDTKIWRHQELATPNSVFTDELFQPVKKNLCPINEYGKWAFPEDITQDDLNGWERIQWARVENIFGPKITKFFMKE
jgi:hypothetical protein